MPATISGPTTERWFYNSATGLTIHGTIGANPTAWFDAVNGHLFGWHQYDTRQAMMADIKAHPGWAQSVGGLTGEVGNIAKSGLPKGPDLGGLSAIGDFFNRLTQGNTWLRVGEVLGGLLLVYMGLRAAFSGTEAEKAVNTVTKPVKKGVSTAASIAPPVRALKVERRARTIAKRRKIESAAGKRATVIKNKGKP